MGRGRQHGRQLLHELWLKTRARVAILSAMRVRPANRLHRGREGKARGDGNRAFRHGLEGHLRNARTPSQTRSGRASLRSRAGKILHLLRHSAPYRRPVLSAVRGCIRELATDEITHVPDVTIRRYRLPRCPRMARSSRRSRTTSTAVEVKDWPTIATASASPCTAACNNHEVARPVLLRAMSSR